MYYQLNGLIRKILTVVSSFDKDNMTLKRICFFFAQNHL